MYFENLLKNYIIMTVKRSISLLLLLSFFINCESDDRIENPFLPNVGVNFTVNLNLPQFSSLEFPGSTEIINIDGVGIKGVIVHNVNGDLFTAYELSDPNHVPNSCSAQTVSGIISTCGCEDKNSYNIITGQPSSGDLQYGLKAYRIVKQGNTLIITN